MRHLLTDYDNKKVEAFIVYVNQLRADPDQKWVSATSPNNNAFADVFKREASKGLYIDGETITLQFRKKIVVSYDYHAYKNKVLLAYPESTFDFDIVYEGDEFFFSKEDGKVTYKHELNNPFDSNKKVKGAYGIIKNSKGEFIELLTPADIDKMRKSSKMAFIWNTWYDRMVKKSIIKRICSVAFSDVVKDIEKLDNENYNPNYAALSDQIIKDIKEATKETISTVYHKYISTEIDRKAFVKAIEEKRKEL